jgi:hypothetical protein
MESPSASRSGFTLGPRRRADGSGRITVGALYENDAGFATPLDRHRPGRGRDVEPVRQQFRRDDEDPVRSTTTSTLRWETVVTPAGTFDALVLHVDMA